MFRKFLKNFLAPVFLIAAVLPAAVRNNWLIPGSLPDYFFPVLSLFFLVAGLLLALYFNSLRLALLDALLILAAAVIILRPFAGGRGDMTRLADNFLISLHYLLPLLAVAVHFTRETDVFTGPALLQFFMLFLFLLALWPTMLFFLGSKLHVLFFKRGVWVLQAGDLFVRLPVVSVALGLVLLVVFAWRTERSFYVHNQFLIFWVVFAAGLAFLPTPEWPLLEGGRLASGRPMLMTVSALLALLVCVAYAWNKAYLDPLTQVRGRMALDEKLDRMSGVFSLAMVDIDKFKNFNDTYGHDAGDRVLRQVARTLEINSTGDVYRFGGEEFTLAYSGLTVEDVEQEIEELRKLIADRKVGVTRKSKRASKVLWKRVTVSIGVSDSTGKYEDAQEVLNAADNALFRAKDDGRNRVEIKK